MKKKILSMVISLVMAFSFAGVMPKVEIKVEAATGIRYPLKGDIVTSSSVTTNGYYCDYKAASGTPVYAPCNGTVAFRQSYAVDYGKLASYGNNFVFTSTDGVYKVKGAHLSSFNGVSLTYNNSLSYPCSASKYSCKTITLATKNVKKGELIGYTGMTGNASGPHLHMEVYKNGVAVNPKSVLDTWYDDPIPPNLINTPIDTSYKTPIGNVTPKNTSGLTLVYNVYGVPYSTSAHNIAPNDNCTIHEVYKTGFCKITYPVSGGKTHTEYAKTADFNLPNPVDKDPRFTSYMPLTAYLCNNATAYVSTGEIWATDKCTITAVYTDGTCDVTYPAGNKTKNVRTSLSLFVPNTSANFEKTTASGKIYAYSRSDMALNIGYTDPGDSCVKVATSGDKVQIIYPISGGHKLGFVNANQLPHIHSYGSWFTTQNASCTENGSKQRKCSICGETETQTINKVEHSMGSWVTKNATCTAEGNKTRSCTRCGYKETQNIAKKEHSYYTCHYEPTCIEKGYVEHICSNCGYSYNDSFVNANPNSHDYIQSSVNEIITYTCRDCNYSYTEKYSPINITADKVSGYPGETVTVNVYANLNGNKCYGFSSRNKFDSEVFELVSIKSDYLSKYNEYFNDPDFPELNEKLKYGFMVNLSKGIANFTNDEAISLDPKKPIITYTFKVSENAKQGAYDMQLVSSLSDEYIEFWVEEVDTNYSEFSSVTFEIDPVFLDDAITVKCKHKYTSKVISATCKDKGYTQYTCSVCKHTYKDTYTNVTTSHKWGSWTTSKNATCTADGSKTRKCSVCGKTETATIAKTGHKYESKVITPTCTEKGYTLHTCSACGDNYKDTYVNAKGHSFTAKEENNYKLYTCSGCKFGYKVTFKGDGTAESPYLISSKEDLLCLSELMLNETTALLFRDKCYKQINDIDLKNIPWTPIGKFKINGKDSACYFEKGFVYDGDNHNIFNLNVNQSYEYAGLFGKVNKGTVKNLAVYGNVRTSTANGSGTGGIVGQLAYGATVSNCCFIGNVTSENCSGGIAGNSYRGGKIINCYFSGNVTSTNRAGGIIGVMHEKDYEPEVHNVIENCYFIGEISGKTTGGIAGVHLETGNLNKNNTSDIINCYYLKNSAEKGFGEGTITKNDVTIVDSNTLKTLSDKLGSAFIKNSHSKLNNGYPVFKWQSDSTAHDYTSKIVAPTCTAKGYTLYTCECGDSYKDKFTDMIPHKHNVKEVVEPTCKKEGYTVYECSDCKATYKDNYVKQTCHKYESEEFDPGNGREPFTIFTCIYCKGSFKDTVSKKHKGDFDKDGTLKASDAVFMKKILTKLHKPTSEEIMIADINQDGTVNVFDMIIMKRTLINSK